MTPSGEPQCRCAALRLRSAKVRGVAMTGAGSPASAKPQSGGLHDDDAGHHGGRAREAHCERLPPPVRVRRSGKAERLDGAARMALECLGKSDALYHNVEHTFLVTLAGQDILHGRMLTERLEPDDY